MLQYLLLAANAAGYALSVSARKRQEKYSRMGEELDRQALQMQFQQEALASSENAFYSSEKLRDVMATQRALFASRGQQSGQGSNLIIGQAAYRAHSEEERARQLSMSFRKHQLDSMQRLMGVNRLARNAKRRAENFNQGFNLLSFNALDQFLGPRPGSQKLPN